jgi:hypothetical protein
MQAISKENMYVHLSTAAKSIYFGIGNYVLKLPCGGKVLLFL